MKRLLIGVATAITTFFVAAISASALSVPPAPPLDRPIVDQTKTLTSQQIDQLSAQITGERGQKSFQIGVLMIPTLGGGDLEGYSLQVARGWGIGEKDKNNGVLLIIAKDDRKMRIEVGSGLEGDLTDLQSSHVIDDVVAPKFRQDDYYGGIHDGLESIAALVQGKPDPHPAAKRSGWQVIWDILAHSAVLFVYIFLWLASIMARTKSWYLGGILGAIVGIVIIVIVGWSLVTIIWLLGLALGGFGLDYAVSRNYKQHKLSGSRPSWWAGGTNFGGGSSGGGSFGGGGFSGGGASGSW